MTHHTHIPVNLNLNVRGLKPSATLAINEQCNALLGEGRKVFRLGFGQSPFPVPPPVVEALKDHAHEKDYLEVKGLRSLRQAIADYWKQGEGLSCQADDILVGPGSKELMFILQLVYYGDLVIPTPSWVSYSPQALIVGRRVKWVKTKQEDDWRLTPELLEEICVEDPDRPRIVVLNYPANPTGATYATDRLAELAEIAKKYRVILLSDEIYGELHHDGAHVSVAKFYPEGTIISSGISKWCGAGGWRLGMFTFPPQLRWLLDAMAVVASETFTSTSAPIQYAAIQAFQPHQEIEDQLVQSRRILKCVGNYTYRRLLDMYVYAPPPQGGFYLFPNFRYHLSRMEQRGVTNSVELCRKMLEDTGVALLPSFDFGRPSEELTARLSYVDFDGEHALKIARTTYLNIPLDDNYVLECCPLLVEAMDRLDAWIKKGTI